MWNTFAATVSGGAAGLTGLMFIVVAFRFETIAASAEYRNRAAQSLTLFLTVMTTGALITIPQVVQALGAELILAGIGSVIVLKTLDSAARQGKPGTSTRELVIALTTFVICMIVGGALLLLDLRMGLYFYAVSAILGLIWGVYGAWTYLTRAGLDQTAKTQTVSS